MLGNLSELVVASVWGLQWAAPIALTIEIPESLVEILRASESSAPPKAWG